VDIVSAGFPCQPFSVAGQQRGIEDERHLWPDVARVIGEVCPAWVLLENVPGLATTIAPDGRSALETVCDDLQELGFAVAWDEFSAAEVGATHLRERIFIAGRLADAGRGGADGVQPERERRRYEPATAGGSGGDVGVFPPGRLAERAWRAVLAVRPDLAPAVESGLRGVADGMADRLDRSRLALTGNGVVPLVAAHAWLTLRTRLEDLT
jgi:DNA (cytosine-5)-methyltransferase 1